MDAPATSANNIAIPPFTIERVFDAPRELVWSAWTEQAHLQQWFGPQGWTITACRLDLRVGGIFHYCISMQDGKEMWGKWTFREIVAPERLVLISNFSDAAGGITRHPMSPTWPHETLSTTTFTAQGNKTLLRIEWLPYHATAEEIATFDGARAGMQQGWGGTFRQLEAYLSLVQQG